MQGDIISSAALAFHKAIIGISQLDMIEKMESDSVSICRLPKAVLTYYILFHLFTICMLLSDNYRAKEKEEKYIGTLDDLNSPLETPEQWNRQQQLESDYATRIKHGNIKSYCNTLRKKDYNLLNPIEKILFDNFVQAPPDDSTPCIKGLYEKVCYIRDRVIYRPSIVPLKEGGFRHTFCNMNFNAFLLRLRSLSLDFMLQLQQV